MIKKSNHEPNYCQKDQTDKVHDSGIQNQGITITQIFGQLGTFGRVALLFFGMFFAVFIISLLQDILGKDSRDSLLVVSVVQNLLAFAIPTIALAYLTDNKPLSSIGIANISQPRVYFFAILILLSSIPWLNQTIYWNEHIKLPETLSQFTEMEEAARKITSSMLATESVGGLIINILVIGCLTGLSEELFFRAGIQRTLTRSMHPIIAIWLAAAIFSLCHFQIYGFIPRMLLGAIFGYLYLYSKSIWVPALMHAINNSSVVIVTWLSSKNPEIEVIFSTFGVTTDGIPYIALTMLFITILLFHYAHLFMPWLKKR